MRVRHERPMADLAYSVRAPLKLTLENGSVVQVGEWSLNGITYPEDADILPKSGQLSIPFQGVDIQFDVNFIDGSEHGELLFKDLTGRQRETLAIFYRSILSGKMAAAEDIITSLDTPVDLVPMGETAEEESLGRAKQRPRILRVIWNVFFYILFASTVFGLIGSQIFDRLSYVSLQHARIVAPLHQLYNSEPSFVDEILVVPGQSVRRGDTLVRLSNPEVEAQIEDIRADLTIYEDLADEAEQRLQNHRIARDANKETLRRAFLKAVSDTGQTNFATSQQTGEANKRWTDLNQFNEETAKETGPHFDTDRQLQQDANELRTRWSRLKRDLGNSKDALSAADIISTTDGIVVSIDIFEDQFLDRGAFAITLEEDAPRVVKAWLNETQSGTIYVGMPTTVRFNDGPNTRSVEGTITDVTASVEADISDAFGLVVTVDLDGMNIAETRATFRTDAPVQLRARKDWGQFFPWIDD